MKAHRFVLSHDFGFIALNILYMYPEDSGTYTLIVKNPAGEARSVADVDCKAKGSMVCISFFCNDQFFHLGFDCFVLLRKLIEDVMRNIEFLFLIFPFLILI